MNNEFKFEPIWTTSLSLLTIFIIYKFYIVIVASLATNLSVLFLAIVPLILSWLILPMTFSMIKGVPALALTNDYLIDNIGGFSIDWSDISEIRIKEGGYRSFGFLIINLKHPEKYFNTPLKKIFYQFTQLFVADDIRIRFDFISGKNETIAQVVNAYWDKHAGL